MASVVREPRNTELQATTTRYKNLKHYMRMKGAMLTGRNMSSLLLPYVNSKPASGTMGVVTTLENDIEVQNDVIYGLESAKKASFVQPIYRNWLIRARRVVSQWVAAANDKLDNMFDPIAPALMSRMKVLGRVVDHEILSSIFRQQTELGRNSSTDVDADVELEWFAKDADLVSGGNYTVAPTLAAVVELKGLTIIGNSRPAFNVTYDATNDTITAITKSSSGRVRFDRKASEHSATIKLTRANTDTGTVDAVFKLNWSIAASNAVINRGGSYDSAPTPKINLVGFDVDTEPTITANVTNNTINAITRTEAGEFTIQNNRSSDFFVSFQRKPNDTRGLVAGFDSDSQQLLEDTTRTQWKLHTCYHAYPLTTALATAGSLINDDLPTKIENLFLARENNEPIYGFAYGNIIPRIKDIYNQSGSAATNPNYQMWYETANTFSFGGITLIKLPQSYRASQFLKASPESQVSAYTVSSRSTTLATLALTNSINIVPDTTKNAVNRVVSTVTLNKAGIDGLYTGATPSRTVVADADDILVVFTPSAFKFCDFEEMMRINQKELIEKLMTKMNVMQAGYGCGIVDPSKLALIPLYGTITAA